MEVMYRSLENIQIAARTMFGPYVGVNIQDAEKAHASGYCWQVGAIINNIVYTVQNV